MSKNLIKFLKGIAIGAGTIIPGISGGTAAIIVGLYEEILYSISTIYKHFLRSIKTLILIVFGAVIGILALTYPINVICAEFPQAAELIFSLTSLLGLYLFVQSGTIKRFDLLSLCFCCSGAITSVLVSAFLSAEKYADIDGAIELFLIGIPLSLALILPAISFSYMLLYFGIYQNTINALTNINLAYILPLAAGIIFGMILFSKLMLVIINKYPKQAYAFVLGFIIISIIDIAL